MQPLPFVILGLEAEALLIAVGIAPGDRTAARGMRVVPILHVVLLGHAGGTGIADVVLAQKILDLRRRGAVDEIPAPHFGLVRAARVPHRDRARLARMQCRIGKDFAGAADDASPLAAPFAPLLFAMREVFSHYGGVLVGGWHRL